MTRDTDLIRRSLLNIREISMTLVDEYGNPWVDSHMIEREVAAALAALSAPVQEPVAWLWRSKDGRIRCALPNAPSSVDLACAKYDGDEIVPLYAHPSPAPVVPAEGPISTLEMVYRTMPDIPELPEAYQPRNIARSLAALRSAPPVGARVKPLEAILNAAQAEAGKAMRKFPQPNYVISKVAEEAGEVVKAAIHCAENRETKEAVLGEVVQCMAMLIRLCLEGDQVHGLAALLPAGEGE